MFLHSWILFYRTAPEFWKLLGIVVIETCLRQEYQSLYLKMVDILIGLITNQWVHH